MLCGVECILRRTKRKSLSVSLRDGAVTVHSPLLMPMAEIVRLLTPRAGEILDKLDSTRWTRLSDEETSRLKRDAYGIIAPVLEKYSALTGLVPQRVRITSAKSYLGCCNKNNVISFTYRLPAYGESVMEFIVLHELAHIRYKNHGRDFYSFIGNYMPDYKERLNALRSRPYIY